MKRQPDSFTTGPSTPDSGDSSRRRFLRSAALGVCGLTFAGMVPSIFSAKSFAATKHADLSWTDLGDGLGVVHGAGGNVLISQGADGVLMIDGGRDEHATQLLEFVANHCNGQAPALLFNSHWHRDQTGCNEMLGKKGVEIIAHENTRLWLTTEVISRWEDNRVYKPLPNAAQPTRTFFWDEQTLNFNGNEIRYGLIQQAHTDGDIYIQYKNNNVIFVGDVVSGNGYPIVDYSSNGWIGGMVRGLEQLLVMMDDNTKVIAGTGGVLSKSDVQAQLDMCDTVVRRIVENYYDGSTYDELLASKPTEEFDAVWGNPDLFIKNSYESVYGHVAQVRGFLRR